jgi:hypothetical protein
MTPWSACLDKVLTTERRDLDYSLALVHPPSNDEPAVDRVFPNGEARARRSPSLHDLCVGPCVGPEPFQKVEDERDGGIHWNAIQPPCCGIVFQHRNAPRACKGTLFGTPFGIDLLVNGFDDAGTEILGASDAILAGCDTLNRFVR